MQKKDRSKLLEHFASRGPLVNIVLDGWGLADLTEGNALKHAFLPFYHSFCNPKLQAKIWTHGHYVGLPGEKDVGGSEVGHMTLGSGKIQPQSAKRIAMGMEDGSFFQSAFLAQCIQRCREKHVPLHLLGLLSDGGVHSHISHFEKVMQHAAEKGVEKIFLHVLLDGRDVGYQSALEYIARIQSFCAKLTQAHPKKVFALASGGGRENLTMDRDSNWEKIERGWRVHVEGVGGEKITSVESYIKQIREENPGISDQDLPPFVVQGEAGALAPMEEGHALLLLNFRGDRMVQFARVLEGFSPFQKNKNPKLLFGGMMRYDQDLNLPKHILMEEPVLENGFGDRLLHQGKRQFRLAETQKYAHVTYFFNGGRREVTDKKLETYRIIPSDKLPSYTQKPEMKAKEIGEEAVALLKEGDYAFGLINFANADMVGHTGDLPAAIKSIEAVDKALGQIVGQVKKMNGVCIITADHGNVEQMLVTNPKTGQTEPCTSHSLNPVPFILIDTAYNKTYQVQSQPDYTLSRVMATNYLLMGLEPPEDIDPPVEFSLL